MMNKEETRQAVIASMKSGKSKGETFDELVDKTDMDEEVFARMVQANPTDEQRRRTLGVHWLLVLLLAGLLILKLYAFLPLIMNRGDEWSLILLVFPLINIALIYLVIRQTPGCYTLVMILSILAIARAFGALNKTGDFDSIVFIGHLVLIGMAFYLNRQVFPSLRMSEEVITDDEGQTQKRMVYHFTEY